MIKNTTELEQGDLDVLIGRFVTDPAMKAKLADFEFDSNVLTGKYAKIPVEIEIRVTPKG